MFSCEAGHRAFWPKPTSARPGCRPARLVAMTVPPDLNVAESGRSYPPRMPFLARGCPPSGKPKPTLPWPAVHTDRRFCFVCPQCALDGALPLEADNCLLLLRGRWPALAFPLSGHTCLGVPTLPAAYPLVCWSEVTRPTCSRTSLVVVPVFSSTYSVPRLINGCQGVWGLFSCRRQRLPAPDAVNVKV